LDSAVDVLGADADARVFAQAVAPTSQSATLFSAVSALVGFLFAFNAMLITVPSRRHLIAELRLDGYSPLQISKVLLLDALIVAFAGIVLGLLAGELVSRELLASDPGYLALAFPVGSQRIVTWQCFALAAAGGLLAALVGVIAPLRRDLRRRDAPPRDPLRADPLRGHALPRDLPRRHLRPPARRFASLHARARLGARLGTLVLPAVGVACLALAAVLLLLGIGGLGVALLAMGALLVALLSLLGGLFDRTVGVLDRLVSSLRAGSLTLAMQELSSPATRARCLAVAATGSVAAFGSVAIGGAHSELQAGLDRAGAALSRSADVWVLPYGVSNLFNTIPFRDTVSTEIARLPGVRAVGDYRAALLDWDKRRLWVFALPASDRYPIPPGEITRGSLALAGARVRAGGWAVVSTAVAAEHGLGVGSRFVLPAPHPLVLRVAALTTNDGWTPGAITMNPRDYERAWGSGDPTALNVMLAPNLTPSQARVEIQRVLGRGSPLRLETASEHERAIDTASRVGLSRLTRIALIVLIGAALAMATALAATIWQRRRRLAALKVDGLDRGELWRALVYESLILLAVGCGVGALFGLYGQLVLTSALTAVTGFPVIGTLAPLTALVVLMELSASATLIVALPGLFAARVAPAVAFAE
jgi:putative ABC transport system permease protein